MNNYNNYDFIVEKAPDVPYIVYKGEQPPDVPYIVYEGELSRHERYIKRMWIALIIAIIAVCISNALWLYAWCQYDFESYEVSTEGGGNANYIGEDGVIYNNGESESEETGAEEW
jgi:hypothetical protein